ncbi:hypothetical protein NO976_00348 [Planktothrix agardhii]|jgi:ubiquinone/menaquinone biosynthesis C-methylase UbiE|uniref:class I SAM-dependent methyltransferase n=1 Tax=Planktothrix agardhii TaxID=1160 RepID=UPI0020A7AF4B|nr:class I SAM-dependent methyltransferase [Planktothrix agardhii]CAD5915728.1 hypothetical protein NO976_00348 [Planktothrix agardhii]
MQGFNDLLLSKKTCVKEITFSGDKTAIDHIFHLESPNIHNQITEFDEKIFFTGWIIGKKQSVKFIRFCTSEKIIEETKVERSRPDVTLNYPDFPNTEMSGFLESLKMDELSNNGEIILEAIFDDGTIVKIATIKYEKYLSKGSLLSIANNIGNNWIESPYYEKAEKSLQGFWDESTCFKKLFNQLDLTHVLELACGHGRHGEKLRGKAQKLTMMDINTSNIEFCTERFKNEKNFEVIKNNGINFQPIPDNSVRSIFCYDAMVHFDHRCVLSYLQDTKRILVPGGLALYHHSNYPNNNFKHYGQNPHARNYMTKELFAEYATGSGLIIKEQIVINWGDEKDLDCITLVGT